eukprot:COSAG01_NODE_6800_length_3493_cov_8.005009_5_plen_266_part_00
MKGERTKREPKGRQREGSGQAKGRCRSKREKQTSKCWTKSENRKNPSLSTSASRVLRRRRRRTRPRRWLWWHNKSSAMLLVSPLLSLCCGADNQSSAMLLVSPLLSLRCGANPPSAARTRALPPRRWQQAQPCQHQSSPARCLSPAARCRSRPPWTITTRSRAPGSSPARTSRTATSSSAHRSGAAAHRALQKTLRSLWSSGFCVEGGVVGRNLKFSKNPSVERTRTYVGYVTALLTPVFRLRTAWQRKQRVPWASPADGASNEM